MGAEATPRRVLIIGATSAIATEVARAYAERGASLLLAARNPERLAAVAADLGVRGAARVDTVVLDALAWDRHADFVDGAFASGVVDVALLAQGVLPDQKRCEQNPADAVRALEVNLTSAVALLTLLAIRFEAQGRGTIAVISSVAGDRGRQSNYVYGASKGGLNVFLQGLRNRLHHHGVSVLSLKPGLIDTPMTAGIPKNPLFATSRRAGRAVFRAIEARKDVAYIPWFWRPIMALITNLPESVFKRLRL
jgi:short-subunit dehydrogenase